MSNYPKNYAEWNHLFERVNRMNSVNNESFYRLKSQLTSFLNEFSNANATNDFFFFIMNEKIDKEKIHNQIFKCIFSHESFSPQLSQRKLGYNASLLNTLSSFLINEYAIKEKNSIKISNLHEAIISLIKNVEIVFEEEVDKRGSMHHLMHCVEKLKIEPSLIEDILKQYYIKNPTHLTKENSRGFAAIDYMSPLLYEEINKSVTAEICKKKVSAFYKFLQLFGFKRENQKEQIIVYKEKELTKRERIASEYLKSREMVENLKINNDLYNLSKSIVEQYMNIYLLSKNSEDYDNYLIQEFPTVLSNCLDGYQKLKNFNLSDNSLSETMLRENLNMLYKKNEDLIEEIKHEQRTEAVKQLKLESKFLKMKL